MNRYTLILKNVFYTRFMQSADMFESFKVMAGGDPISVTTTTPFPEFVEKMKAGFEGKYAPIAIRDESTGEEWIGETVKVISFGKKWCLFSDYIKRFGFKGEIK